MRQGKTSFGILGAGLAFGLVVLLFRIDDPLLEGFQTPPHPAKPHVWWHWMNGNVTKEGITADLEWMKRVGIGGFQMFDASLSTPQFVDNRLAWMTPEWKAALRHAAAEADRLGLEMAMAASGGWSETGGPWVKPEAAMKKVVWSETDVAGPIRFSGKLPLPPAPTREFRDTPSNHLPDPALAGLPGAKPMPEVAQKPVPTYHADTKVIAYRVPEASESFAAARPKLTSSYSRAALEGLLDGKLDEYVRFDFAQSEAEHWVQFEFADPYPVRTFSVASSQDPHSWRLEVSQDGKDWSQLTALPKRPGVGRNAEAPINSYTLPENRAKYFRLVMERPASRLPGFHASSTDKTNPHTNLAEIHFSKQAQLPRWQEKAQFGRISRLEIRQFDDNIESSTPSAIANGDITPSRDVIDLSAKLSADGTLNWSVPEGRWKILRLGYSLTGKINHPATPEATGLEVDKLSPNHMGNYFKTYTAKIEEAIGPYLGKSFQYFLLDSWEAGMANWTDTMLAEFEARRGYDPTPYLPVLTGAIIDSVDISERFLWDLRRTIADLFMENHYAGITALLEPLGIGLYAQTAVAATSYTRDALQNMGSVAVPMGEFWYSGRGEPIRDLFVSTLREAASAAHIYGRPIVGAEAFTTNAKVPAWGQSPYDLKGFGDQALALGVNRMVFHTSAHQPFVDEAHKPGMTLGPYGQHYTRNITWAEQAKAWNSYLARGSYMLQQGRFIADFAYYYGEGAPVGVPRNDFHPAAPEGYSYDWWNTEILLQASVEDGRIVLPSGMSYRLLVLPEDVNRLTLPVVQKIRDLVAAGGAVLAPRPGRSPSLMGYPAADDEIHYIANEVWGAIDGKDITEHDYGKGKVYWGKPVGEVLASLGVSADVQYNRPEIGTELVWTHRRKDDADIYFIASRNEWRQQVKVRFRIDGKEAELWHPDSGKTEPAGYRIENDHTTVPVELDPYGSVFVVFRDKARESERKIPKPTVKDSVRITGPWQVRFPPNWGAPNSITLDTLISWTESENEGVKYFSGTARYLKEIDVPSRWLESGKRVIIDLGDVQEMAELVVNGKPVEGVLWKPPYRTDITEVVKPGRNKLEVQVTNLWPNRMIGDLQPSASETYTFTGFRPFKSDSPLLESGLLGPVTLLNEAVQ